MQVIKASAGDWLAVDKQKPWLRVSPDWTYWLADQKHSPFNRGILEAKTFNNTMGITIDNWRDLHLDYFCQVQYQLHVLGLKHAFIGFLNVDTGEHFFDPIDYDKAFCTNTLIPAIDDLWLNHITPAVKNIDSPETLTDFAPPSINADDVTLRYPNHTEGKSIEKPDDDFYDNLQSYLIRKSQIKQLETENKAFEDSIKVYMDDAEFIPGYDGKPLVTWKANKPSLKFDEKRFASDHPELYKSYQQEKAGARIFKVKS